MRAAEVVRVFLSRIRAWISRVTSVVDQSRLKSVAVALATSALEVATGEMTRVQGTRSRLVEAAATPLSETSPLTGVAVVELPTTRRLRSETAVTVDPVVVDLAKQITEVRAAQQREPRIRNSEVTVHLGSSLLLQLAQLVAAVVVRAVLVLLRGLVAQERPAALLGVP